MARKDTQLEKLLNACQYDEVLECVANRDDADATYYCALAFDQLAAFRKNKGQTYKSFLNRSRKVIDDGLRRFPGDMRFLFLDGLYFLHAQQPSDALMRFTQLYKKTHDPRALVSVGNAYKALNEYDAALKAYRRAEKAGLSKLMMAHNIAITYKLMYRPDLARKAAVLGLQQKPKTILKRLFAQSFGNCPSIISQPESPPHRTEPRLLWNRKYK